MFPRTRQDDSRKLSENTKWGIAIQFESGRVLVNTTRFLGYDKNEDGELIINEEQAELVRRVFSEYLDGKSYAAIAKGLMSDGIKTITGNEKWWDSTISGMLENEKYYGDALLQKTITVDFLNHKRKDNKGQAQKYMVNDNHQPIISKERYLTRFRMRRNEEPYSREIWLGIDINIAASILLVLKYFAVAVGIFLKEGNGIAQILQRKLYGSVRPT